MSLFKPISISLSPNTEKDDVRLAFKLLFHPWKWKKGATIEELESQFEEYLEVKSAFAKTSAGKYAISFNSGRSALVAVLNAIKEDDPSFAEASEGKEVLLQAFTCNAAANPIIWSGLKPVYVDCDEKTFNIKVEDLKRKITSKSRAVMVQHTFGLPADMDEILEVCRENNLILIEDCAHSLGAEYKGEKVGTFGKAAFFSFSRDKVISSIYGGMVVANDDELAQKLQEYQKKIGYPSNCWIFQQLLHPILMNWLILPTYRFLGKYFLILFQWLQILSKAVHWKEKRGRKPDYFPKRLPNALAILALNQFKKLEKLNQHRKEIADFYYNELKNTQFKLPLNPEDRKQIFLRFTVKHPRSHEIIKMAWQNNLLIGDWYESPIAPHDTKLDKLKYLPGTCPQAEKLAGETLNLPTHINISKEEAQTIVDFLRQGDEVYPLRGFPSSSRFAAARVGDEVYPLRGFPSSSSSSRKAGLDMEVKEIKDKNIWENFLLGGEESKPSSSPFAVARECEESKFSSSPFAVAREGEEKTFLDSWSWGEFQIKMGNKIWRLGIYDNRDPLSVALVVKTIAKRGTFLLVQHGPSFAKATEGKASLKYEILKTLLEGLKKIAREEKADFIRMNPLWERNQENQNILRGLGFREAPMHANAYEATWKLDISIPEEELLQNMRKTTRYLIRKIMKNQDITVEKSERLDDVEIYQKLNKEVAKRQKFVPFSFEYIKNEFEVFSKDKQVLWFFGKYKGELAAAALVIFWSGIGFYHQAASSSKYTKLSLPYLLSWEAIREAKRRGCNLFDFWGYVNPEEELKHPWAGPTLFKMGFNGYKKEYVKTQDFPLSKKYWLIYIFEMLRKTKRGL